MTTDPAINPFHRPHTPSAALASVLGSSDPISRPQATRKVWVYIRKNELQDTIDRRRILVREALIGLFPGPGHEQELTPDSVSMFEIPKMLKRELTPA